MIYEVVLNSQHGPHEFEVRHLEDGTVQLSLPHAPDPLIIQKKERVRFSAQVPGAPVPVTIKAWRPIT